jgi:hypothetical protein
MRLLEFDKNFMLASNKKAIARFIAQAQRIGKQLSCKSYKATGNRAIVETLAEGYEVAKRCYETYRKNLHKTHFKKDLKNGKVRISPVRG